MVSKTSTTKNGLEPEGGKRTKAHNPLECSPYSRQHCSDQNKWSNPISKQAHYEDAMRCGPIRPCPSEVGCEYVEREVDVT